MKQYRLKKEAVQFFKEGLATDIKDFDFWQNLNVTTSALEEVEPAVVHYGHKSEDSISTNLCGWDKDGSKMRFTIHFPSTKIKEHDEFSKGHIVRKLMDEIQYVANNFLLNFNNEESL